MMKRFVVIVGAVALLAMIGCSGGSWEETNAFSPVADAGTVSGETSENTTSNSVGSSSSKSVEKSVASSFADSVVPTSSQEAEESNSHVINIDLPMEGASSSAMAVSPSSYAVPSSSAASPSSSAAATNLPTTSSDSSGKAGNPVSSETDTAFVPFDPPVEGIVTIGSQVWMRQLGAGGKALDWDRAMAPGVCPEGFRLPTYGEADSLLHMNADGSLADGSEDGIGIITGGSKRVRDLGWSEHFGRFWTTEEFGESGAYYFGISDTEDDALLHGDLKTNEFYVRCIKD